MTKFILLANGRSGSEWLATLLDSHYNIHCCSEAFKDWDRFTHFEVMKRIYKRSYGRSVGFKVMYSDNVGMDWLKENYPKVKIMHLKRDHLTRIISCYIGATNRSRKPHSIHKEDLVKYRVTPEFFRSRLKRDIALDKKYTWSGQHIVDYEDLLSKLEDTLAALQIFLGEKVVKLTSNLVKQNPYELEDYVINLDELKEIYEKYKH